MGERKAGRMRLIDADALKNYVDIQKNRPFIGCTIGEAMKIMVDEQPAIEPERKTGWIPCSERLPEDGRQVLVYARSVHFALAKYDELRNADGSYSMQWVTFDAWKPFYTIKEVIAWMPLPEPYKMEGSE